MPFSFLGSPLYPSKVSYQVEPRYSLVVNITFLCGESRLWNIKSYPSCSLCGHIDILPFFSLLQHLDSLLVLVDVDDYTFTLLVETYLAG